MDEIISCRYLSDFRVNISKNLCLSFLTDKVLKGFDDGLLTGMILIDMEKAFDTINHETIFMTLSDKFLRKHYKMV